MRIVVLAAWLVLMATSAQAADLCVNTGTGSDSNTRAQNADGASTDGTGTHCWATVWRAVKGTSPGGGENASEAATAGDTVWVAAGIYSAPGTNTRNIPAFNTTNSGTSGSPLVLHGIGTVHLQLSSGDGPTFGCYARDYVTWYGFSVDEANGVSRPDTGPVVAWSSTGCRIEYNTIDGNGTGHNRGDNHTGVRVEDSTDAYVGNNTIHDVYTCQSACTGGDSPVNAHNGAGIQTYGAINPTIEHNVVYNVGSGIFLKGGPWSGTIDGAQVRYNHVYDVDQSALVAYAGTPAASGTPTIFSQNVVHDAMNCFRYWFFNDATNDPLNTHFINNTCFNVTNGFSFNGTAYSGSSHGFVIWNNIISTATSGISSTQTASWHQDAAEADYEHNVYHSVSGTFGVLDGGSSNVSLATWNASPYTQDSTTPVAITSDPLFVNAAGDDFRICTGVGTPDAGCSGASPALSHGRATNSIGGADGATIAAGAYITGSETIGIVGGATVPDPPTIGAVTAGDGFCRVAFTPPGSDGGATITSYTATSSPGSLTGTGSVSPITVTGLTNGQGYTFTVVATNSEGNSTASSASATCTPVAPVSGGRRIRLTGEAEQGASGDWSFRLEQAPEGPRGDPFACVVTGLITTYANGDLGPRVRCVTGGAPLPVGTVFTIPRPQ